MATRLGFTRKKARGREKHAGMRIMRMNSTTPRHHVKHSSLRSWPKDARKAVHLLYCNLVLQGQRDDVPEASGAVANLAKAEGEE